MCIKEKKTGININTISLLLSFLKLQLDVFKKKHGVGLDDPHSWRVFMEREKEE